MFNCCTTTLRRLDDKTLCFQKKIREITQNWKLTKKKFFFFVKSQKNWKISRVVLLLLKDMGFIFFVTASKSTLYKNIFRVLLYEHQKEAKVYTIFFFKFFNKYFCYCLCEHFIFSVSNIIIFHLHFISLSVLAYLLVVIC